MSNSVNIIQRAGAYEHPFSSSGIQFNPLGVEFDQTGIVLHETGYDSQNSNWNFPRVLSPFWRLYYNHKRGHCVVFGDQHYELDPGQMLLIPDHQMFHCLGQRPIPTFWVHFSVNHRLALSQSVPVVLTPQQMELDLIESIEVALECNCEEERNRIFRLSVALLNMLLSRSEILWRPNPPERLTFLLQYIETHAELKICNQELAQKAGVSIEGVYRLFRAHLGTSPTQYINQIRIRKASHLLLQHNCSIDEVAERTGFPNRAYFSRVFKQITGTTPGAFCTASTGW